MESKEQVATIESFLREVVIHEVTTLGKGTLRYAPFVVMGEAIEVLGAFLDAKPLKAKGQSAVRFSLAVKKLLGGRYRILNDNGMLYDKLRNQMTHTFMPSQGLLLTHRKDLAPGASHLSLYNGQVVLVAEEMAEDIVAAAELLISYLEKGLVKPKMMVS